jgi:hypothetical protein
MDLVWAKEICSIVVLLPVLRGGINWRRWEGNNGCCSDEPIVLRGGATGYAGYAPAYPAQPECILYVYVYLEAKSIERHDCRLLCDLDGLSGPRGDAGTRPHITWRPFRPTCTRPHGGRSGLRRVLASCLPTALASGRSWSRSWCPGGLPYRPVIIASFVLASIENHHDLVQVLKIQTSERLCNGVLPAVSN